MTGRIDHNKATLTRHKPDLAMCLQLPGMRMEVESIPQLSSCRVWEKGRGALEPNSLLFFRFWVGSQTGED